MQQGLSKDFLPEPKGSDVLLPMMTLTLAHQREVGVTLVSWLYVAPFKFEDAVVRSPYLLAYLQAHLKHHISAEQRRVLQVKMERSLYPFTRQLSSQLVGEFTF